MLPTGSYAETPGTGNTTHPLMPGDAGSYTKTIDFRFEGVTVFDVNANDLVLSLF